MMEISTLSLSSSFAGPSPSLSLPLSSSNSLFFHPNSSLSSKPRTISLVRTPTTRTKRGFSCTCLFGLGVPELVVIAGVAALVFGPKKLPEVGRSIGKTVKSFQQAAKEFETELKKEPDSLKDPPEEKPAVVSEEEKENAKISSSKESL